MWRGSRAESPHGRGQLGPNYHFEFGDPCDCAAPQVPSAAGRHGASDETAHRSGPRRGERIPITSVARTLLDFAAVARPGELISAIEQAERLRIFDMRAVDAVLKRSNGQRGAAALREALRELTEQAPDLRSPLEERFRDYCKQRKLPIPAFNVMVAGFLIDAVWLKQKVAVELDSRRHHMGIRGVRDRQKAGHQTADGRLPDCPSNRPSLET